MPDIPVGFNSSRVDRVLGFGLEGLTLDQLRSALATSVDEDQAVEYKRDLYPPKGSELAKDVAAMANSSGGAIFVGVDEAAASAADRIREVSCQRRGPKVDARPNWSPHCAILR